MSTEQTSTQTSVEQTKQQIRNLVNEIAQLSKSSLGPEQYYPAFLQRVVGALAAVGGAVWTVGDDRRIGLNYQINLSETLLDPQSEETARHMRLLGHVMNSGEPQLVPPLSGPGGDSAGGNPTRYLLVLAPLQSDGKVEGVVEIFQRADSPPATQRGYMRFLLQMLEYVAEWLKTQKLQQISDRNSLWVQADQFARHVHDSLDLRDTAYTVANEGRRLIGCDRVSVAIRRGSKCKVEAVSGQDTIENRSNVVAALGVLATRVIATGEPLWYDGSTEDLPPQLEEALDAYVDESYGKSVVVLPLYKPDSGQEHSRPETATGEQIADGPADQEAFGAMIIEQIEMDLPQELLSRRIDLVYEHATRALANAQDHNSVFLMPVWRLLGKATWVVRARTLPKTLTVVGLILAVLLALAVVPGDFDLKAKGSLQPIEKRDIFASIDGVVMEVLKDHGEIVEQGEVLAVLRNTDLEVQLEDVLGQRQATREQLTSVERLLIDQRGLSEEERSRLSGQRAQHRQRLESLNKQYALLETKRERLKIRSPIAGRVVTWDVRKQLRHRPVQEGQILLTVADPHNQWELELLMPERRMGHLDAAQQQMREDLDVAYILATDPGHYRYGKVKEVHTAAHMHEEDGHSVRIRVQIDKDDLVDPRPGATVTAMVNCGRRPLGYVWFHEVMEWIQAHVLF